MSAAASHQSLPVQAHGIPNWVDLQTARVDDARAFYESLLGWTFRNRFVLSAVPKSAGPKREGDSIDDAGFGETPVHPDTALMALSNDQPVADLVERSETFVDMALLSTWFPYVYCNNLDATLKLVEPAGGLILNSPARRGAMATVATILDPSDALLCLWEPIGAPGIVARHQPGSFTWVELETPDLDLAKKFYGELFGWDAGEVSIGDDNDLGQVYTVFTREGERVAGAIESPMAGVPASWCPSFAVDDVDMATIIAARNGGVLMAEPVDMPVGRQAVIVDPTGAAFSILGPKSRGPRPL